MLARARSRVPTLIATTALLAAVAGTALAACGHAAGASARPLPTWAGHEAEVFDDSIEPAALGIDFDRGYSARSDAALRERAQTADAVVRVRVTTVTAKRDARTRYTLGVQTRARLLGEHPPDERFELVVDDTSASHGMVKSFESRLVGKSFVAFVKEFVRSDGDRELHFHLAPDTKDVELAVSDAKTLFNLK